MDALSEVLRRVQLSGAVFFNAELSAPWALLSPSSDVLARVLMPEAEHLIEYHLLLEGDCWIRVGHDDRAEPLALAQGDLVMVAQGDPHRMSSDREGRSNVLPSESIELPTGGNFAVARHGGGGAVTRLVCGYLAIDRRLCAPLLDALPPLLHVNAAGSELDGWLRTYLRLQLEASAGLSAGSACVLSKLSELMFVEAIRRHAAQQPADRTNWLAGLRDPAVSRALAAIHAEPAERWTVDSLAREAGVSRSGLAARFTELIGQSPMHYLTQWRLRLAAHLLRTTSRPASSVGFEVGYESEAAFSRAFRREFGSPPSSWRRSDPG